MKARAFICAGLLWLASTACASSAEYIGGDSLGLGAAAVSGLPSFAKSSSGIFNNYVLRQLKSVPDGSRFYLFLGTNDAVGLQAPIKARFDTLAEALKAKKLDVVWVGPPCVVPAWNKNIAPFDAKLGEMVRESGFVYVSLNDFAGCRLPRLEDGVHFVFAGYQAIWKHVTEIGLTPDPTIYVPRQDRPAPRAEGGPGQH